MCYIEASPAMACIQEIQEEAYRLGIPLKTRHREVAPNQYEVVALFGKVTEQVDHNILLSQIIEEVAVRHNLAALLHEKPFQGINGSGKHNNWSLRTNCGANLFNYKDMLECTGSNVAFAVMIAALVQAIDTYGSLMRMAITVPGNEFRLGACEAPPAIMSVYLGEALTRFLEDFKDASDTTAVPHFKEGSKELELGSRILAPISIPAQDRNRTSPFPFITDRFEFRAVGSSQNVAMVNTVLASIMAKSFKDISRQMEECNLTAAEVAQRALNKHWRVIFNGNNYDEKEQEKLTSLGLCNIQTTVEALLQYSNAANTSLFSEMKVFTPRECQARQDVSLNNYIYVVEIEGGCLVDMLNQQIIPALSAVTHKSRRLNEVLHRLEKGLESMQSNLEAIQSEQDLVAKAAMCERLRREVMLEVGEVCKEAESLCPLSLWPIATFKELLFLDQHHHTSDEV